jgi:hypothetical protein
MNFRILSVIGLASLAASASAQLVQPFTTTVLTTPPPLGAVSFVAIAESQTPQAELGYDFNNIPKTGSISFSSGVPVQFSLQVANYNPGTGKIPFVELAFLSGSTLTVLDLFDVNPFNQLLLQVETHVGGTTVSTTGVRDQKGNDSPSNPPFPQPDLIASGDAGSGYMGLLLDFSSSPNGMGDNNIVRDGSMTLTWIGGGSAPSNLTFSMVGMQAVPEPGTYALILCGGVLLFSLGRKSKRRMGNSPIR